MEDQPVIKHGTGRARGRGRGSTTQPGAALAGGEAVAPPPQAGPPQALSAPPPQAVGVPPPEAAGGRGRADRRGGPGAPPQATERPRPGPPGPEMVPPPGSRPVRDEPQQQPQGPAPGRALHRGPGASRPGNGDSREVTAQMQGLAIGGASGEGGPAPGSDVRRGRRRGALGLLERLTKPSQIQSKQGTSGQPIQLVTNLFQITQTQRYHLNQYHVDFNPEVPSKRMRLGMIQQIREALGIIHVFDGVVMFLPIRLEKEVTEFYVTRQTDNENIRITVKFTCEVIPTSPVRGHILNLIFKRCLRLLGLKMIYRNYFNPLDPAKIPQHNLEIWPGYMTAIQQYEVRDCLIADVAHKILSIRTAFDTMKETYNRIRNPQGAQEEVTRSLVGEIVLTRYNNKTYRIDDVDWSKNPTSRFSLKNGTEMSFVEYYKTSHQLTIHDLQQPLLVSMPKKKDVRAGQEGPILLVPELCTITGLAESVRTNFTIMRDIAQYTRIGPTDRAKKLERLVQLVNEKPEAKKEFDDWNLVLDRKLLKFQGRILQQEKVFMGQKELEYRGDKADWTNSMRNARLAAPMPLEYRKWIMIFPNKVSGDAQKFYGMLQKAGGPMGMDIEEPLVLELRSNTTQEYIQELKKTLNNDIKLVFCVLLTNRKDMYDALKVFLCIENPVPSQMITARNLGDPKKGMSIATKVAIQMNCKMGGEVWTLEIPLNNTMVVGLDTYHDSAKKGRSVVGIVASLNRTFSKYVTKWVFQGTHEELCNGLSTALPGCLKKYFDVNKILPEKIIIYRDGVGDGMLDMVMDYELPQITKCIESLQPGYKPQVTMIIVKKRINSRFFALGRNPGEYNNPPPGTVVDTEATRREWFDFFIVSQAVTQGTVTPTHYHVIHHDERSPLKPEHLQRLSYKLCHLYYNWPGTVRVPAPCQYAHKVAFLIGQSLHKDPHVSLSDKLFYL